MTATRSRSALHAISYEPLSGALRVADLAGERFLEPFFDQSIAGIASDGRVPHPFSARTEDFVPFDRRPRLLIVHTGRCGSTLLANALSSSRRATVIKEPGYLHALSVALVSGRADQVAFAKRALRTIDGCLLAPTRPSHELMVIKTTSWTAIVLDSLIEYLNPEAVILMHRAPAAVVRSELLRPPAWELMTRNRADQGRRMVPNTPVELPTHPELRRASLFVAAWKQVVNCAGAAHVSGIPFYSLSYEELVKERHRAIGAVFHASGVTLARKELRRACNSFDVYSKDPSQPFALGSTDLPPSLSRWVEDATKEERQFLQHAPRLMDLAARSS
jgi:hypothetical protein